MRSIFRPPASWRHRLFRYRLLVWRCIDCGAIHHYRARRCRRCGSTRTAEDLLPERGRLIAFTTVRAPLQGYENNAPYPVGIIEFDDGTRILATITDCEPEDLKEGMIMERVFRKIADDGDSGIIIYGFKFRPVVTQGK